MPPLPVVSGREGATRLREGGLDIQSSARQSHDFGEAGRAGERLIRDAGMSIDEFLNLLD